MVRKVKIIVAIVALCCAFSTTTHAATFTPYEGNPSNTQIQYFKDILSGAPFNADYVAFRSSQYNYILVIGDLTYYNGVISLDGDGKLYEIGTEGNYNSSYTYSVSNTSDFKLNTSDRIIYSNVGDYPELIERGAKYEMLSTLLLIVICCSVVISRVFYYRKR